MTENNTNHKKIWFLIWSCTKRFMIWVSICKFDACNPRRPWEGALYHAWAHWKKNYIINFILIFIWMVKYIAQNKWEVTDEAKKILITDNFHYTERTHHTKSALVCLQLSIAQCRLPAPITWYMSSVKDIFRSTVLWSAAVTDIWLAKKDRLKKRTSGKLLPVLWVTTNRLMHDSRAYKMLERRTQCWYLILMLSKWTMLWLMTVP